ncbi:MAG: 30S ribosomal protein S3 [Candidatus Cloacimonetes bacterium]|nr:30S ribosomal protein S3 [Candidatus Cloacimonadota bacterium]
MAHPTDPRGFRLTIKKDWGSVWHNERRFKKLLHEDIAIRKFLRNRLKSAGLADIVIKRSINEVRIKITVAKPGLVIGRGGAGIEELKKALAGMVSGKLYLDVEEEKKPDLNAKLIAEGIAQRVERRYPYKRAVTQAIEKVKEAGAKGVKIAIAGVLSGASSISRTEKKSWGVIPTSTMRANVDFAKATAFTKYGTIGVKVWIYKPEEDKRAKGKK